jgi:Zn-dependent peptidase ImmA (M78 family)
MQPDLYARAVLERLGLTGNPDVYQVASKLGVPIREKPLESCEGMLVRVKGTAKGVIAVRDSIREVGRKLFTIAHEIGHLMLPGHEDCGICTTTEIESWAKSLNDREREANVFAAELLMPRDMVVRLIRDAEPSLSVIDSVAGNFRTSLTASGCRFADVTPYACAMVWSQARQVKWAKKSGEFKHWLRLREVVDARTLASDLFDGASVPVRAHAVPAEAWIDSKVEGDSVILEESRALPFYNAVLTLLWVKDPIGNDEDKALEPLDPADFSLGRRTWPMKKGR